MSLQIGMLAKMNVSSVALLGWGRIVMVSYDSGRGELYFCSDLRKLVGASMSIVGEL